MNPMAASPQPPPLPRAPANGPWNIVALAAGATAYLTVMYRFQTYTQRNNLPATTYELFAACLFLLGFGIGLVAVFRAKAATFLIIGVWAAHAVIIGVDLQEDPSNHNLLPFEFIYLFVLSSPAYLGALLSRLVKRPRLSAPEI
jgi:hypothetical protein